MLGSKVFRQTLFFTPIWFAGEYAVMYAVASFFTGPLEGPALNALLGRLILYAFRLGDGVLKNMLLVVTYYLTKKQRVEATLAMFYENKLPLIEGASFLESTDYFAQLAASDEVSPQTRCFAAATLGELNGLKAGNRFLIGGQAYAVLEAAFERYKSENIRQMHDPELSVGTA